LAGMERAWQLRKCILADDVGIGKTPQSIGVMARALWNNGDGNCVVVTTASTKGQWVDEIQRFAPQLRVQLIDGHPKERAWRWKQDADVFVASYEYLLRGEDYNTLIRMAPLVLVCDEAFRLAGHTSKTTQRAKDLAMLADRVLLLHATPVERGLENLFSLMTLIDDRVLGSVDQFQTRFCRMTPRPKWLPANRVWRPKVEAYVNVQDFRFRVSRYIIRRTIKDVGLELPGIIPLPVYCTLTKDDEREYAAQVAKTLGSTGAPNIPALRRALSKSKAEDLKARMLEGDLTGERLVVFSEYKTVINQAAKVLEEFNPMVLTGDTSNADRRTIVRNFGTSDRAVLLMTEAGSRGLNLQAAHIVVNLDLPWTHGRLRQRIGRVCRIGQNADNIRVLNYVAVKKRGGMTVDHWLLCKVAGRRDLFAEVMRDDYEDEIGVEDITPTAFRQVLKMVEAGTLEGT